MDGTLVVTLKKFISSGSLRFSLLGCHDISILDLQPLALGTGLKCTIGAAHVYKGATGPFDAFSFHITVFGRGDESAPHSRIVK